MRTLRKLLQLDLLHHKSLRPLVYRNASVVVSGREIEWLEMVLDIV